jgi:acylphosphatase
MVNSYAEETTLEKISAHVIVQGRVQGVYFRAYTRDQARLLGLNGWVMNRRDGSVEALFEGKRSRVEDMVAWCRQGPPTAQVDQVEVEFGEFRGEGDSFEVRYR